MPSGRVLAKLLGVARNTVVLAYQQLVDEGFLEARERSGYFVNVLWTPSEDSKKSSTSIMNWNSRFKLHPSAQRNITKPTDWQRYPYPFVYGQFDPSLFPTNQWRECARSALSVLEIQNWARDMIDNDDPELIDQIRLHILPRRGIWASPSEIMITMGTQQGLSLVAQLLVSKDSVVGVENPGYPDARNIFGILTQEVRPLAIDRDGLLPDEQLTDCDVVFATLAHQCPTGVTMPPARRTELMNLARLHDFLIVEDDYAADMLPDMNDNRALKSHDEDGRVIYLGSLSKTLAPGLRLGFVVAPEAVIRELRALRRLSIRHPSTNNQRTAALFFSLGHYRAHLNAITGAFARRSAIVQKALDQLIPGLEIICQDRSASLWVTGRKGLNSSELARVAETRGVLIEPGDVFYAGTGEPSNNFRMGVSSIPDQRIERGVQILAECMAPLNRD